MNNLLRKEIYRIANSISSLTGNVFYVEAPQNCGSTYCVFLPIVNNADRDTGQKFEEQYLQVSLFGKDITALEAIFESVKTKFDDAEASFSVSGWNVDSIDRQNDRTVKNNDVWQIDIQYKIELSKK